MYSGLVAIATHKTCCTQSTWSTVAIYLVQMTWRAMLHVKKHNLMVTVSLLHPDDACELMV